MCPIFELIHACVKNEGRLHGAITAYMACKTHFVKFFTKLPELCRSVQNFKNRLLPRGMFFVLSRATSLARQDRSFSSRFVSKESTNCKQTRTFVCTIYLLLHETRKRRLLLVYPLLSKYHHVSGRGKLAS